MSVRSHPNVVLIVGCGDISCYGGLAPTPRVDGLAAQGLRFKNYNVEAQCTPTRSAILTGRVPIRTGNCSVQLPGQGHYGLAPWAYRLGELFSDAGYASAAFGKCHVGDVEGRLPTDQGLDEWFGIKNTSGESGYSSYVFFAESGYPVPRIWEGVTGSPVTPVADFNLETRPLLDDQLAARAAAFIKRNAEAGKPFFAYVCFTQMRAPLIHHPEFTGKSDGGVYSDTLAELDHPTGQILDAFECRRSKSVGAGVEGQATEFPPMVGAWGLDRRHSVGRMAVQVAPRAVQLRYFILFPEVSARANAFQQHLNRMVTHVAHSERRRVSCSTGLRSNRSTRAT